MTTTTIPAVGEVVRSSEAYAAMPVGSQIQGAQLWEKIDSEQWCCVSARRNNHTNGTLNAAGRVRVVRIGPESRVYVGFPLDTQEDFDACPIGTVMGPDGTTEFYVKTGEDQWQECNMDGGVRGSNVLRPSNGTFARGGYNKILSLPGSQVVVTIGMIKQQFRDAALRGQRDNGVSMDRVQRVLTALKVQRDDLPLGTGVAVNNPHDLDDMPEGTRVYVGTPERFESFGLFAKQEGYWQHVLGGVNQFHDNRRYVVDVVEGEERPAEWWSAVPDDNDAAIALFKGKAWELASKEAREASWCGVFNNIMLSVGISEESLVEARAVEAGLTSGFPALGSAVRLADAAQLPEGTGFTWRNEAGTAWAIYVRDDSATNRAKTRLLVGYNRQVDRPSLGLGGQKASMVLRTLTPENGYPLPEGEDLATVLNELPVGTIFNYRSGRHGRYVILSDRSIGEPTADPATERQSGPWNVGSFGDNPDIRIIEIPA